MARQDIGWEHAVPFEGNKRKPMCRYCGKVMSAGITRLKQHLGGVTGEVDACTQCPKPIRELMRKHISEGIKNREETKRKKEQVINSLTDEAEYGRMPMRGLEDYEQEQGGYDDDMSREQMHELRMAMRESRRTAQQEEDFRRYSVSNIGGRPFRPSQDSAGPSAPPGFGTRTSGQSDYDPPHQSFKLRDSSTTDLRGVDPFLYRPESAKYKKVKDMFFKENVKKVGKAISKFFMFNAIPFNAADSGPYYQVMIDTIAQAGSGIRGPSGYQIGGIYLREQMDELNGYLAESRKKWPEYGCTLMCDGWSSRNKHSIVNFMIYCDREMLFHKSVDTTGHSKTADYIYHLMDTVVEEVGEENVVQIVTDNEASFKAAGKKLMKKRKHMFWSPCAAHCIDLMLEDIGEINKVKAVIEDARKITSFIYNSDQLVNVMRKYTEDRELLRPGITRFATEFIAIESLLRYQQQLKRMFSSHEWQELSYVRTGARRGLASTVSDLVLTDQFWRRAEEVRKVMEPLVKVLKIVDQDQKPTLGVIYDCMDRAKLAIKLSVKDYKKYWKIIDERWEHQLHAHLHAAAYFLNPMCQYHKEFSNVEEVRTGLKEVIKRLEPDLDKQSKAINEIKLFRERKGEFNDPLTRKAVSCCLPAEWWSNYGESAPNLRKIAIKVLSQTCSSSGCERNWSTFALIHTKLRNRLAMDKLQALVYVHYNLRLRVRNLIQRDRDDDHYNPIDLTHIFDDEDILHEWIREREDPNLTLSPDEAWLQEGLNEHSSEETHYHNLEPRDSGHSHHRNARHSFSVERDSTIRSQRENIETSQRSGKQKAMVAVSDSSNSRRSRSKSKSNDDDGSGAGGGGGRSGGAPDTGMTWAQGDSGYICTQDTDHGYRPMADRQTEEDRPIDAQRKYWNRLVDFPSDDDVDSHPDHRHGYNVGVNPTQIDLQMRGINLGQGPSRPNRNSRSTSTSRSSHNYGHPIPNPRMPRMLERSTSVSGGNFYDHQQDYQHGNESGSGSNSGRYGYSDYSGSFSVSSGPTSYGYEHYGRNSVDSARPHIPYPQVPQPGFPGPISYNSIPTSQDPPVGFGFSLFYYPLQNQYYPPQPERRDYDDFDPPRHSMWE